MACILALTKYRLRQQSGADVGTAQCHVDEQRHTFLRLPKINPQIGIKYVEDWVGVSLIFLCVASLFCVGVSTLVCPVFFFVMYIFFFFFFFDYYEAHEGPQQPMTANAG